MNINIHEIAKFDARKNGAAPQQINDLKVVSSLQRVVDGVPLHAVAYTYEEGHIHICVYSDREAALIHDGIDPLSIPPQTNNEQRAENRRDLNQGGGKKGVKGRGR